MILFYIHNTSSVKQIFFESLLMNWKDIESDDSISLSMKYSIVLIIINWFYLYINKLNMLIVILSKIPSRFMRHTLKIWLFTKNKTRAIKYYRKNPFREICKHNIVPYNI